MRLLFLTSPELRGHDVHNVQVELRRHKFPPGPLDGVYGPATAAAVRRFQRACQLEVDGIVGPITARLLEEETMGHAPSVMPGREPPGLGALHWMIRHDGITEDPPRSNNNAITREFRLGRAPWCMEAVSLAFKHGGEFILGEQEGVAPWGYWPGRGFAYVPAFEAWVKTRGFWLGQTTPHPGDVVVLFRASHVGIVERYLGGGQYLTREGNTGIGNDTNGGELMQRHRYMTDAVGFAHIKRRRP